VWLWERSYPDLQIALPHLALWEAWCTFRLHQTFYELILPWGFLWIWHYLGTEKNGLGMVGRYLANLYNMWYCVYIYIYMVAVQIKFNSNHGSDYLTPRTIHYCALHMDRWRHKGWSLLMWTDSRLVRPDLACFCEESGFLF
jgi:hypothetical protein